MRHGSGMGLLVRPGLSGLLREAVGAVQALLCAPEGDEVKRVLVGRMPGIRVAFSMASTAATPLALSTDPGAVLPTSMVSRWAPATTDPGCVPSTTAMTFGRGLALRLQVQAMVPALEALHAGGGSSVCLNSPRRKLTAFSVSLGRAELRVSVSSFFVLGSTILLR